MSCERRCPHPRRGTRPLAALALLSLAAVLDGCFGGGFHSNQPLQQEYLLSWPAGGTPAGGGGAPPASTPSAALEPARSLQVLLPAAAPGLEGTGIAVLRPGERLDDYGGARWAATAPQMLQTLAIQALRQQGRFALVESDSAPFAADWELQLELTHFEADYTHDGPPTVRVGLVATLGRRNVRRALMTVSIDTHATAAADRMGAVIAAFQSATTEALQQIAERVMPLPAASDAGQPAPASGQR